MTHINNLGSNNLINLKLNSMAKQEPTKPASQETPKSESGLINKFLENQAAINKP